MKKNPQIPDCMLQFSADLDMSSFSSDITNHMGDISNQYESYKVKVRNGELGKTPKFWLMSWILSSNNILLTLRSGETIWTC